jgi:hypothetical protein
MDITKNELGEITYCGYTRSFCESCIKDYEKLAYELNVGNENEWEDTTDYQSLVEHWEQNLHEIQKMEKYEIGLLQLLNWDGDNSTELWNKCLPILSEYKSVTSQSDLDDIILSKKREYKIF